MVVMVWDVDMAAIASAPQMTSRRDPRARRLCQARSSAGRKANTVHSEKASRT